MRRVLGNLDSGLYLRAPGQSSGGGGFFIGRGGQGGHLFLGGLDHVTHFCITPLKDSSHCLMEKPSACRTLI